MNYKQKLSMIGLAGGVVLVAIWMVGTKEVKDGKTAIQLFHDHAEKYIVKNREGLNIAMAKSDCKHDINSHQFHKYQAESALYKLYGLEGKMDETERQIQLDKKRREVEEHEGKLKEAEEMLDKISNKFTEHRVAIQY